MKFEYEIGQTPIDANEAEGLILPITTQAELNQVEEQNIVAGRKWVLSKRILNRFDPFSSADIFELHKRMLGDVWKWAGTIRLRDKNIGVPFYEIRTRLKDALDDARYWMEEKTYDVEEIAIRVHHRLVKIHLFANGNGRHARMIADVIVVKKERQPLTWGSAMSRDAKQLRTEYIAALKKADEGDYTDLLRFCRS